MIIKGTAYIRGSYENCYIGIEDGKIDFVKKSLKTNKEVEKFDGVILPAGIDMHVHFREPGMTEKEDFYNGSVSAAYGGITAVMDMPNNDPAIDSHSRLEKKIKIGRKKSVIDFGLYGLMCENVEKMAELTDFFKVYMASSTGDQKIGQEELKRWLKKAYSHDVKVAFHCEDEDLFYEPGENLAEHNEHRPLESELEAIEELKGLPEGDKYVCHLTSKKSLDRTTDHGFLSEVTPHHLFLSEEAFLGPFGKVNPPLRSEGDRYSIWEAFERGELNFIASDHAPHLEEEKEEFADAPSGVPGVETLYPLLLNSVSRGKIDLSTVIEALVLNPAERLGLKRGKIKEGYDAELVNIDFRDAEKIRSEKLHYKCGWTPFEGFQGIFPQNVISKGEFLVKDREFMGEKGRGEYIGDN
ncbi:MAG: dihydroorotase [Candidatus Thermoplasmatota archaeon]|nr:dihydroorotase [Candidatus Thermoplasmatota archaeon]